MSKTFEISTVGQLRQAIAGLSDERPVLCQVIATNGQAWNMFCELTPDPDSLKGAAVLQLKHRDLKWLPGGSEDVGNG